MKNLMTWDETQDAIRAKAKQMPHGWQAEFARQQGIPRQQVNDMVNGRKPITSAYLQAFLDALGLELLLGVKR